MRKDESKWAYRPREGIYMGWKVDHETYLVRFTDGKHVDCTDVEFNELFEETFHPQGMKTTAESYRKRNKDGSPPLFHTLSGKPAHQQENKDLKKESDIPLLASQNNWACCAWCTWVKVGDTKEVSEEALGRHVRRCSGKPKSRVGTKAEQAVEHNVMMQEEHQASLPKVEMDGATLFNLRVGPLLDTFWTSLSNWHYLMCC